MQIGIVPVLSRHSGSIYQRSLNLLTSLYHSETTDEFILFAEDSHPLGFLGDRKEHWRVTSLKPFHPARFIGRYIKRWTGWHTGEYLWKPSAPPPKLEEDEIFDPDVVNFRPDQGRWFARNGADFLLYPAPSTLSFEAGITYVVFVHDLQYRIYEQFPQYAEEPVKEQYDYLVRNALRYAALIIVDSQAGADEILQRFSEFGVAAEDIRVLPPLPASYLDPELSDEEKIEGQAEHDLAEPYVFIPDAYKPQKNGLRLLDALEIMEKEYTLRIPVVMCGSTSGRIARTVYHEIRNEVISRGRQDHIACLTYVPDEHMSALYAGARIVCILSVYSLGSMIVPEAWAFGVPLIASRDSGIDQQAGDAALIVDPNSPAELAEVLRKLWTEPQTRASFAERGKQKHAAYPPAEYAARLSAILQEAKQIVEAQGMS